MLRALLTALKLRCPSVVYVNSPYLMLKTVRVAVNISYWWIPYA
jgi:hypothetical protein